MEGNFYISNAVVDRELRSHYGIAYQQCRREAREYGKCVEAAQVNRNLERNSCFKQRADLRECVHLKLKGSGKGSAAPFF